MAGELLRGWVERGTDAAGAAWYREALAAVAADTDDRALGRAIGLAPRKLGKADLALGAEDLAAASRVKPGFDPSGWSIDQAARISLVLVSRRPVAETLDRLFPTADLGESVAYYRGFAIFPDSERLLRRAGEGVRSAIKPVFEAIAHRNPYPREHFDEPAWNQMVLKALFIGAALAPIQGLDERANPELALMLVDYAHERWAAARPVSPELWRSVGPYADARVRADLERLGGDERDAAMVALAAHGARG